MIGLINFSNDIKFKIKKVLFFYIMYFTLNKYIKKFLNVRITLKII